MKVYGAKKYQQLDKTESINTLVIQSKFIVGFGLYVNFLWQWKNITLADLSFKETFWEPKVAFVQVYCNNKTFSVIKRS